MTSTELKPEQVDFDLTEEQRVDAGVAWLDETRPTWVEEIDLELLDLSSASLCVLGQIVKGECSKQWKGVEQDVLDDMKSNGFDVLVDSGEWKEISLIDDLASITLSIPESVNRGFHITYDLGPGEGGGQKRYHEVQAEYMRLTALWKAVIIGRRMDKALS